MSHHRETVTAAGLPTRSARIPTPSGPAACCSSPARSRSTRNPAGFVGDTPPEQARRCLENLAAIAAEGGCTLAEDGVKLTVYLTDIGAYADVNEVYAEFYDQPPARVA